MLSQSALVSPQMLAIKHSKLQLRFHAFDIFHTQQSEPLVPKKNERQVKSDKTGIEILLPKTLLEYQQTQKILHHWRLHQTIRTLNKHVDMYV